MLAHKQVVGLGPSWWSRSRISRRSSKEGPENVCEPIDKVFATHSPHSDLENK